jgi:hypothetical protein
LSFEGCVDGRVVGQVGRRCEREAVRDAEPPSRKRDPFRVWVLTNQVPEGTWGAGGNVVGLADIVNYIINDPEAAASHATRRLAITKSERDAVFA